MSKPSEQLYDITLSQLAPDAKKADFDYGTIERPKTTEKDLRTLLMAATALAPKVTYPLTPEIRIAAPTGRYVVQLKEGRLQFVSWASAKSRGGNPTFEQIIGIVSGEIAEGDPAFEAAPTAPIDEKMSAGKSRGLFIALMVFIIIGVNGFTFWNAKKPPGNFLPKFQLIEPAPAARLLTSTAGAYETGRDPGDRRLQIAKDGGVVWIKFGAGRSVKQQNTFTVQAAESAGKPALLTSTNSMITIKDPTTLVYFGDTYIRVMQ